MKNGKTPESVLEVSDLAVGHTGQSEILRDVSFTLCDGERVGIVGSNGSGKTTLFLTLCGILKPLRGSIKIVERPVVHGAFHPEIGMVFQNPDDQLFCPTVGDDVAFGPTNLGLSSSDIAERVQAALTTTGCLHLADRAPHHLSGGEKRMVAIAGVLAMQPRLVLYDEPDAYLDRQARRRLITLLQQTPETIIIASHDISLLQDVCQRVLVLDNGKLVADGALDNICPSFLVS